MEKEEFDFERFKAEAMRDLYEGKKMGGAEGVFAPMLKHLLESKASGEVNRKNGKTRKTEPSGRTF